MPKLKTKAEKKTFSQSVKQILDKHNISYDTISIDDLVNDFQLLYEGFKIKQEPTDFWDDIVQQYFEFYKILNGVSPTFVPHEAKSLKEVSKILKRTALEKSFIWDRETALKKHLSLYQVSCSIPYVKNHFSIGYIYNNFDKIVSEVTSNMKQQKSLS